MAILDMREPAVYTSVEDVSYAAPAIETGRVGYAVIICDRGPSNKIVKVTSQTEFHKLFGKPNFRKCSQSFYLADKFLQYSSNLLVCRITPSPNNVTLYQGESSADVYAYTANSGIYANIPLLSEGLFKFINENGRAEIRANSEEAYNGIDIGTYIYSATDVNSPQFAKQVIQKYTIPGDPEPYRILIGTRIYNAVTKTYTYTYEEYPGTISSNWEGCYKIAAPVKVSALSSPTVETIGTANNRYKFINNQNYFIAESDTAANNIYIGRWVFGINDNMTHARRVVSKVKQIEGGDAGKTYIYLDRKYTGTTSPNFENAKQFAPTRYHWITGQKYVYCGEAAYNLASVGDWVYPSGQSVNVARQIYSKEVIESVEIINSVNRVEKIYRLVLDKAAEASLVNDVDNVKYHPFAEWSTSTTNPEGLASAYENNPNIVFFFYANGAGSYYNNIKIIGSRNTELEKQYLKDNGTPKYKYVFMNIAVYQYINGQYTLLEGPWSVSLIPRAPEEEEVIRDYVTGDVLFIEDVINKNSKFIRCIAGNGINHLITSADAEDKRLQCMLHLCYSIPTEDGTAIVKTGAAGLTNVGDNGVILKNGSDGLMFDRLTGYIRNSNRMNALAALAYRGYGFTSSDGSVELLPEYVYSWYQPDYILAGGWPASVQNAARELADIRGDCIVLGDTGTRNITAEADIAARRNSVPWNSWNAMLYTQYREIFDPYTGEKFWITPVYHAVERHLHCDGNYWIAEPVAGIEKGAISDEIKLAYKPNHTQRGDLIDVELNPTIYEPQGTYFLTQFTTWKRLSVLKRAHVAKFVCYLRKVIPTLLKDILQRKATSYWINNAKFRIDTLMSSFVENTSMERYSAVKEYKINLNFDEVRSELNVILTIRPIRAIERIHVMIQVA